MKTKKINIAGHDLLLYERSAKDVLDLADFIQSQNGESAAKVNLFIGVQTLLASLKPNLKKVKWFRFIKKYKLKKIISYQFLFLYFSISELDAVVTDIHLLEGNDIKKKVMEMGQENESAGKSQPG